MPSGFHSIGFPCERGGISTALLYLESRFPFNWFPLREGSIINFGLPVAVYLGFHSIGFPCERGARLSRRLPRIRARVSIQLVSPARGELRKLFLWASLLPASFHSIGFPCERGAKGVELMKKWSLVSIQLVSPARGEWQ